MFGNTAVIDNIEMIPIHGYSLSGLGYIIGAQDPGLGMLGECGTKTEQCG
jgi:hypothetical protein